MKRPHTTLLQRKDAGPQSSTMKVHGFQRWTKTFKSFLPLFLTCMILIIAQVASASSVTLTWNRNQEPDIAGYKIYWGKISGHYSNSATVQDRANTPPTRSYTIDNLEPGTTYYFSITAFDLAGQESVFSDEATIQIAAGDDGNGDSEGSGATSWTEWYETQNFFETGNVTLDHHWKTVHLSGTRNFVHPVVIAGPPTRNGSQPCVIRIRNVTSTSFDIRLQEWTYLDQSHVAEHVSWMVIEAGEHVMLDGSIWQAGTFSLSNTLRWKYVRFPEYFNDNPVVFTSSQTFNGPDTFVVRKRFITPSQFLAAIQEEESKNDGHYTETIGYLAVSTNTSLPLYEIQCNHSFKRVTADFDAQIIVEEEQSKDTETNHVYETVGVLFLNNGVFADMQTFSGSDTASLRRK